MSAYAVVRQGCPIQFHIRDSDALEISIGGNDQPLMLLFDAESFSALLEKGAPVAQQMGQLHSGEQAEPTAEPQ
jgi:hypothetical protein